MSRRCFAQSEQLATKIKLSANHQTAWDFVQQMPRTGDKEKSEADWQHIGALLDSLQSDEQLSLSHEDQLYRLFHNENTRLLNTEQLHFIAAAQNREQLKLWPH